MSANFHGSPSIRAAGLCTGRRTGPRHDDGRARGKHGRSRACDRGHRPRRSAAHRRWPMRRWPMQRWPARHCHEWRRKRLDLPSLLAEIKPVEPPVIARPSEPARDLTGPIVARDMSTPDRPAAEAPKLREAVDRTPLGRREPFVSAQPLHLPAGPVTVDVPLRPIAPVAPVAKAASLPETVDVNNTDVKIRAACRFTAGATPAPARKLAALKSIESQRPALAPGKVLSIVICSSKSLAAAAPPSSSVRATCCPAKALRRICRSRSKRRDRSLASPARAAKRLKHEFDHAAVAVPSEHRARAGACMRTKVAAS